MRNWKKIIGSSKLSCVLLSIIAVLLIVAAHLTFDRMATTLYDRDGDNPKAKGELLTTYLSIIGGGAVFYGLYLNNKRIREQTEQNNIARTQAETAKKQADIVASNNNDKRFGDAIGYLNSENGGVAIGGAYALYQLAKEDDRYTSIVGNVFFEFLSNNTSSTNSTVLNIITRLIFDNTFNHLRFNFIKMNFSAIEIANIVNKDFNDCNFDNVRISELRKCNFGKCYMNRLTIRYTTDISVGNSFLKHCRFMKISEVSIEKSDINICHFVETSPIGINQLLIRQNKSIKSLSIHSFGTIKGLSICNNLINDKIEISAPLITDSKIASSCFVKIKSDNFDYSSIIGDSSILTITPYDGGNSYFSFTNKHFSLNDVP